MSEKGIPTSMEKGTSTTLPSDGSHRITTRPGPMADSIHILIRAEAILTRAPDNTHLATG